MAAFAIALTEAQVTFIKSKFGLKTGGEVRKQLQKIVNTWIEREVVKGLPSEKR